MLVVDSNTQVSSCIQDVATWFCSSGIQTQAGGVARFYRSDTGANAPVSTEITGYAVSALLYLHNLTGEQSLQSGASSAVRFLTRIAWNPHLETIPFEPVAHSESTNGLAYFFDCGIICRGLLAWWHHSGDREALKMAVACGEAMARDFRLAGSSPGEFAPVIELPSKAALPLESRWSRSPGCYQLKAAMAWLELADVVRDAKYRHWYDEALDAALGSQEQFLPDPAGEERTMDRLHAYCYFLEGLLRAATRPGMVDALRHGMERVSLYLDRIEGRFARSDVYAQLLRVRLFADTLGLVPLDTGRAAHEASSALSFQRLEPGHRHHGGFWFGRRDGSLLPYVNPVSSAFCAQALEMWQRRTQGRPNPNLVELI